ncbi:hypothetical protein [Lactiplantibacillus pentosus]|uniref:hypothetical protein n=1 Tax=Lactiplantibacillus pentosus TaxID=1589 RepID=UPI001FD6CE8C|nr:hypothetical protein [Lactiplantibacillus pentosus]MCJ8183107.1 hypothetical protein [Lactiplantibacillus pentosus]
MTIRGIKALLSLALGLGLLSGCQAATTATKTTSTNPVRHPESPLNARRRPLSAILQASRIGIGILSKSSTYRF